MVFLSSQSITQYVREFNVRSSKRGKELGGIMHPETKPKSTTPNQNTVRTGNIERTRGLKSHEYT